MGMFDSVLFGCLECGQINEFQSKSDECCLINYTLDDAPLPILVDMFNSGIIECEHCGCKMRLDFLYATALQKINENLEWKRPKD